MSSLFDQNIYKDKWLLILGIPLLTFLTQHIGLSVGTSKALIRDPDYLPIFLYNLLGIVLIFLANKCLILRLDHRLPYRPHFRKRLWIQLGLGLLLTLIIGELHSYFYIRFLNEGISWSSRYITDLPFTILLTVLVHFIYIGYYLRSSSRKAIEPGVPSPSPTEKETDSSPLMVSVGNKNIRLRTEEIALLASQNRITQVFTLDGKRFITAHTLKQAYELMGPADFFPANRQIIINRTLVKGYRRLSNRKLELILETPDLFTSPIYVSKEKTPHFLQWLSA